MVTFGSKYGVRINGALTWFDSYAEAAQTEAEQLYKQVEAKRAAGGMVVLVGRQVRQYETARRNAGEQKAA